ncbi:MAG TPA: O-antigen ligase domain-containing protein [Flavobacteriaceae bacterium]|nr:O-antigen ligase domain-containing protein [Flavobacteriaceae bacterium]
MHNITIKNIILIISTSLIFLNLTIYLPFVGFFPFPAYFIDLMIFISIVIFYLKKGLTFPYQNIIVVWILYYTTINISYFIASPTGIEEFKFLKLFFFFLFMFFSFIFLFNLDDENMTTTRKTTVVLAPILFILLAIDYFEPGYFYFGKEIVNYVAGRASAVFLNANIAGGASVLLLILGIDMIPKKLRFIFIIILFLGVFFTMSRSNIMIFILTLIIMFFQKKLYASHLLIILTFVILFFTWLTTGGFDTLSDKYNLEVSQNMKSRVNFFANNKSSDTGDMNERREVLSTAIGMYTSNPIFGTGYASTRLWDYNVSPHNTLAMHWADYGIFGILLIPLMFFFSSVNIFKYGNRNQRHLAFLIITYFLLSCFFSHNMLEQPLQIAPIIMLSVIGHKVRNKYIQRDLSD